MKSPTEVLLAASATEKIRQLLKIGLTFLVLIFLFFLLLNPNHPAPHDDVLSAHQAEVSSHPFRSGRGRYKTLGFDIRLHGLPASTQTIRRIHIPLDFEEDARFLKGSKMVVLFDESGKKPVFWGVHTVTGETIISKAESQIRNIQGNRLVRFYMIGFGIASAIAFLAAGYIWAFHTDHSA